MKYVIYVGVFFMPDKNAAAQRAVAFSKIIETVGYKPVVIGMNSNVANNDILKTESEYNGIKLFEMKYPSGSTEWFKMLFDFKQIVRVVGYLGTSNCQAIIAMDYFSPALRKLFKYCNANNIRLILDTVDWFGKSSYRFPKNLIKNFDTYWRMHLLNKKSKYLITISDYLENYYRDHVHYLVNIPGIYYLPNDSLTNVYNVNSPRIISFIGSPGNKCEKEKIDWVIKAVCKSNQIKNNLKFVIAGIDKETLQNNRPDLFTFKNFDESVVILGRINHKDCLDLLSKSDFTVIIREKNLLSDAGFPTKLGESFACGTPVIATPTSNISDYIPSGYGVITDSCVYDDVEKAIFQVSNMSDEEIANMHELVRNDNPLSIDKFTNKLKTIVD